MCQANGWTRAQFEELPASEQTDWLAFDDWKRQQKLAMWRSMRALIDDGKPIDGGGYLAVWLSLVEG